MSLILSRRTKLGGGALDPTSVSGMQLWLKADAVTGKVDGDLITTWNDSSGNGKNGTNAGGATRPTYKTNIINGLPVMRFVPTNVFDNASFSQSTPVTLFFVARTTLGTGNGMIFSKSGGSGEHTIFFQGGVLTAYAGGSFVQGGGSLLNTFHVLTVVLNGASSAIYIDGGSAISTGNAGSNSITTFRLGANTAGDTFTGDTAEALYYTGALSLGDRQTVQGYLGAKYGITVT